MSNNIRLQLNKEAINIELLKCNLVNTNIEKKMETFRQIKIYVRKYYYSDSVLYNLL